MLDGKVVVITGSTSGVGLGTAKAAMAAGAKVFIHGPTAEAVEAASVELGGVPGIAVDLILPNAGTDIIEGALAAYGRIDGVVNNAGIFPRQTLEQTDAVFFDRMFAINARSPLMVAQRAAAAFMTMTRNLSNALAEDLIRVNQLNLGWILTETEKVIQRLEGRPDDWFETVPRNVAPIGRLLHPEDVAKHVVFWLSDFSAPVTGQVYEITQTPFLGRG